jgi:hypothetical protein
MDFKSLDAVEVRMEGFVYIEIPGLVIVWVELALISSSFELYTCFYLFRTLNTSKL